MTDDLRGALYMTLAMGLFAMEDMALKQAAMRIPMGQALLIFGLAGLIGFAVVAHVQGQPALHPAIRSRAMLIRSGCEIGGRLFYSLAFALGTLSAASAILQATPLMVALGAVLFFDEKVGWRRWTAIAMGFGGVLMILKPDTGGLDMAAIFAVLGVLGFAMLSLAGAILLGLAGGARWPPPVVWAQLALATLAGTIAYGALTRAMRTGALSMVSPFRYTRLLFALVLAVTVFGEQPDGWTLLGSAVIVTSGVALLKRNAADPRP